MKKYEFHRKEKENKKNEELIDVEIKLKEALIQIEEKDKLIGEYWQRIQDMRLSNRLKRRVGFFFIKRLRNKIKANFSFSFFKNKKVILLKIPVEDWLNAHNWGDYHFALSLRRELKSLGYKVIIQIKPEWYHETYGEIVIVIRGLSRYKPSPLHLNLMWNISHPTKITLQEYGEYDHVFIASEYYAAKLSEMLGLRISCLMQCSDINHFYPLNSKKNGQIVFVGNSHGKIRPIVEMAIKSQVDFILFGKDWKNLISDKYIKGEYISNSKLREVYSSSLAVLNDHWPDMKKLGFLSNRVFDVLACNGILISDNVQKIEPELKKLIYTVNNPDDLCKAINTIRNKKDSKKYSALIAKKHSFHARALEIDRIIKEKLK